MGTRTPENLNYLLALDARGIDPKQQEEKLKNLIKFGCKVLKAVSHDRYKVEGKEGYYNPYTDTWSQP